MKPKTRVLQVRRFGRAGESVTHGDRRKRELVFEGPFPPLTARPNQRRAGAVGLTGGASPLGGSPTGHKNQGYILTPVGHPFITHPARRFAPITVRQDWNAVRQELEQVSDSVGIRNESGLSQKPHRVRTWSPRGQTPVLEFDFNWKKLSVIGGITVWNFYFQLYPGAIKSPQVIDFLKHLQRQLPGKLLVIWDGAMIHRSRLVRAYLESLRGQIYAAALPAYAPELNPTEYVWGYFKQHRLPNFTAKDIPQLSAFGRRQLRNIRRRPKLITAFWKQAELW